jgi:integrase/recombinase XerD
MANRKQKLIGLYLKYHTPEGKQSPYRPVLYDAKNRLRPGWCLVAGQEERHPDCTYHLRYKKDGVWKWEGVGDDPNTAMTLRSSRSYTGAVDEAHATVIAAEEPDSKSIPSPGKFRLAEEVKTYLTNCEKLAPRSHKAYRLTLVDLFPQSCKKIYVHQITKQDLQAFDSFLLKRGDEDRTRANRVEHVTTFLRNKEGRRAGPPILGVSITIKYTEAPPEAYTRQELEDLFRVSCDEDKMLWRFFIGTGFRESEVSVAEYTDVNPDTKSIVVTEKPYFGFIASRTHKTRPDVACENPRWYGSSGHCPPPASLLMLRVVHGRSTWDRRSPRTYPRSRNAIWEKQARCCPTCSVPCDRSEGAIAASYTPSWLA